MIREPSPGVTQMFSGGPMVTFRKCWNQGTVTQSETRPSSSARTRKETLKCGGKPFERLVGVKLHSVEVIFVQFTHTCASFMSTLNQSLLVELERKTGFHFTEFPFLSHITVFPELYSETIHITHKSPI